MFEVFFNLISLRVLLFVFVLGLTLKSYTWLRFIWRNESPLSKIPGPRIAAWTRLWIAKTLASGQAHETWIEINAKHGPLARIGPKNVVTDDPDFIRRILEIRSDYRRARWFDALKTDPFLDNLASTRDPKQHASMRTKLAPAFKMDALKECEAGIDKVIGEWIAKIRCQTVNDSSHLKTIDIGKNIQYLTMDVITKILLGIEIGSVATSEDVHNFLDDVKNGNFVVQFMTVLHELTTVLRWIASLPYIGRFVRAQPDNGNALGRMIGFINQVMHEKETAIGSKDIVTSLLAKGIDPQQVSSELLIALVAGSDTTATAVQYTMLAVMTNPRVYSALKAEIRTALSNGNVSSVIQYDETKQLPYLQACILEGLRKYSPLAQLREREVPEGGDFFGEYFLPAGTFVGVNIRGVALRKDIYGDDAVLFRPERWFETDPDKLKKMNQAQELIFGYGATKCLGYGVAMMEISKVVFEIFRHFDATIAEPHKPWTSSCYGTFYQEGFNVVLYDTT